MQSTEVQQVLPTLQPLLDYFGIAISALTGVLAARGRRVDLFGVLVLAMVTGLGGGTVRDLLMGQFPVFWVQRPEYLLTAAAVAVVGFVVARRRPPPRKALEVADAFALALFSIVGAKKALALDFGSAVAITMGVITGVTGGILRDVLLGEVPLVFRKEIHLYATASLLGAGLYVTLYSLFGDDPWLTVLSASSILGLRLAAMRWQLSLPLFDDDHRGRT